MRRALPPLLLFALALSACSDPRGEARRIAGARVNAENAVLVATWSPKSVVFRNEQVRLRPDVAVVCGEFNGLTRNEDWAGYTRFVYAAGEISFEDRKPDFAERWREACASS